MSDPGMIPDSTLRAIQQSPVDQPLVLLLRHSTRGPIPAGESGNDVLLLPEGVALAEELGTHIGSRLCTLQSSPVQRCVQTAAALAEGSGVKRQVSTDTMLGDPGVYVEDGDLAWQSWLSLGHEQVMGRLVADVRLPGLAQPTTASRRLVRHMLGHAGQAPGVHVFVTHDALITVAAAHCLGETIGPVDFPVYLEALALLRNEGGVRAMYRQWSKDVPWL